VEGENNTVISKVLPAPVDMDELQFALYLSTDHQQEFFYIFTDLRLHSEFLTQQHI